MRISNRPSSWPNLRASLNSPSLASPPLLQKKHLPGPMQTHQRLRQPPLRLVIIKIGDVNQLARLLDQRLGDGRVRVAQRRDRDAAAQVQIALARHVIHIAARRRGSARCRSGHSSAPHSAGTSACTAATSLRTIGGGDRNNFFHVISFSVSRETGTELYRETCGNKAEIMITWRTLLRECPARRRSMCGNAQRRRATPLRGRPECPPKRVLYWLCWSGHHCLSRLFSVSQNSQPD